MYKETDTAEEYNKQYCYKLQKPFKRKVSKGINEATRYYLSLDKEEQLRLARSYLSLLEYKEAHKIDGR